MQIFPDSMTRADKILAVIILAGVAAACAQAVEALL
jgi:hypothetical protein